MPIIWLTMPTHIASVLKDLGHEILTRAQQLSIEAEEYDRDCMFFEDSISFHKRIKALTPDEQSVAVEQRWLDGYDD